MLIRHKETLYNYRYIILLLCILLYVIYINVPISSSNKFINKNNIAYYKNENGSLTRIYDNSNEISLDLNVKKEIISNGIGKLVELILYLEQKDGTLTLAGWDTRKDKKPFEYQCGISYDLKGFTLGLSSMKVGERAFLHIPPEAGYGALAQGQLSGSWYIPANSDLVYDVEVLRELDKTEAPEEIKTN